jgi:hypothetical protein
MMRSGWRELGLVLMVSALATIAMTYPLAFKLGGVGRVDNADGVARSSSIRFTSSTRISFIRIG